MAIVQIKSNGSIASIIVDGKDLSNSCSSYQLSHEAGYLPQLVLTIDATEVVIVTKGTEVGTVGSSAIRGRGNSTES